MPTERMIFIAVIVTIAIVAWLLNNLIRARHGFSVSDGAGRTITREDPEAQRMIANLSHDNGQLVARVARLEDRLAVLERIATDPAERTAREIDALR